MAYPIEDKLVVGISTNALFDLTKEDEIFKTKGVESYKKYQIDNRDKIIEKGIAYSFTRRLLNINKKFPNEKPIEVVLLSKNSPETGLRVFNSIKKYGLDISRAAFTSGKSPFKYIPSFNIALFLSTDKDDVKLAIEKNYPAGLILNTNVNDEEDDDELRIAFDFDGVLADDEAEEVYQKDGIEAFQKSEIYNSDKPLNPGLMLDFFKKLSLFQRLEEEEVKKDKKYKKIIRTGIITARNAPAHERAIKTLESWNVNVDEMFFLGGIEKKRILNSFKPHLFIDDQINHLDKTINNIPLVHIPFGIINK